MCVIKGVILAENINVVVADLTKKCELINLLCNNDLPANLVDNLLKIFQATSVPKSNATFEKMQDDLANQEILASLYSNSKYSPSGNCDLKNDMASAEHVLAYVELIYQKQFKDGKWDAIINKAPGKYAFLTEQSTKFQHPS